MGVRASMSISLLREDKLWGLIACHHYSGPHAPPYATRAAAEFLGSTLSLRLVDRAHQDEVHCPAGALHPGLADRGHARRGPATRRDAARLARSPRLAAADGVVVHLQGHRNGRGAELPPGWPTRSSWAASREDVVATDSLP